MTSDTDFRFLAEHSADVICRFGVDRRMHYVSPSCVAVLGWTPEEILAMPPFALVLPEDVPMLQAAVERDMLPGAVPAPLMVRNRKKDGTVIWIEVSPRVIRDAVTGEAIESVLVLRDATERKKMEERLSEFAYKDALTGLANRRLFDDRLLLEWQRTLKQKTHLSLILLDVDHFKQFNDSYGHQVGDDCLRSIGGAITRVIRREVDTGARYGGEELAAILPETDSAGAVLVAHTLRQAILDLRIAHPGNPEGGGMVSASFGVATAIVRQGGTIRMPEGLLMAADHALYKAKHGGRNRIASTILMAPEAAAS